MSTRVYGGRRRAVLALAAALGTLAAPVRAQDARATAAQSAARAWLAITDQHGPGPSWEAAGALFRDAMSAERWAQAFKTVREPLGAVERRTIVATRFDPAPKGLPRGDYALVQFRSSYAKRAVVQETVTLARDSTGAWRVVGYAIT